MKCKYYTIRTKKYKKYAFCRLKKEIIPFICENCLQAEIKANKTISKRSTKQNQLEKERDKNLIKNGKCEYCKKYSERLDTHEVYRWK